jgi:hypothetical protein
MACFLDCRADLGLHLATLYRTGFVAKALPKGDAMARKGLSDRTLKSLKPKAEHYDKWDIDGFGVRVSDKGTKTFILMARYPGSNNPTRRAIGHYPTISLAKARQIAAQWREWIAKGKDPADEIDRQRAANRPSD